MKHRQILYGSLIVNEIVHWVKKKMFMFKVDFEKAYGFVLWEYLDLMMDFMGFCIKWRGWVQGCLSSSWSSVLLNGNATKEFAMR